jgi:hypothetical protein
MPLLLAAISACATVTPTVPAPLPADTPIAVIGEFECGELQGILVITKDGKINPVADTDVHDLQALAKLVPDGSSGMVNMSNNCPPRQRT